MMKGDREKLSTLGFILCPHAKILKIAAEIAKMTDMKINNVLHFNVFHFSLLSSKLNISAISLYIFPNFLKVPKHLKFINFG